MNLNFAKTKDGYSLEYAPSDFDYKGVHYNATNNEKIYNAIGYLCLKKTERPVKEGFYYTAFYVEQNNVLLETWEEHEMLSEEETATEEQINEAIAEGVNSIDN